MSGQTGPPPPYPGSDQAYPPPPNPAYPGDKTGQPGAYGAPPGGYPAYGPPPPGPYPAYGAPAGPYSYPAQPGYQGYGQPAYGQPGYQSGQTTVVVTQPALTMVQTFRETPVHTRCPHCQAEIVTGTHFETGTFTWIICLILCLVGCDLGCCLIPFCVDGCKDVVHTCPNCRQQIARWSRM